MNTEENLIRLRAGVDAWNQWRIENRDASICFAQIDLNGMDLEGFNLTEANLSGADLRGVNLNAAQLERADLSNADLSNAQLNRANFDSATLINTNLRRAHLVGANLSQANLHEAILFEAECCESIFRESNLTEACLKKAILHRVDFSDATMKDSILMEAQLNNSYLVRADLRASNLKRANLIEADCDGANFGKASLEYANLSRTKLLNAKCCGTDFTGACLQDWHINSDTNLSDAHAEYFYWKSLLDPQNAEKFMPSDRRPREGEFKRGEFTAALAKQALNTVDMIFVDGIDWSAFFTSFQKLRQQYREVELDIQAMERKASGDFVIRFDVSEDADKAAIEQSAKVSYERELRLAEAKYRAQLQAKEAEIESYKRESAKMEEITKLLASRSIQSTEFNNTFHNSSIGNVANQINDNANQYAT